MTIKQMTYEQRQKKIKNLERRITSTYHINRFLKEEIIPSPKVRMLAELLLEQINKHNASIERQITRLRKGF